jgi:hypothetical protein
LRQHRSEWNERAELLTKKYKKLSAKLKPNVFAWPAKPVPPPVLDTPCVPHVRATPKTNPKAGIKYKNKKVDISKL